jgi:hypothetical protein
MLTATQTGGFPGAGLAGAAACLPQVSNLVRARCPADISWLAFEARLLASLLTTARASAIHDGFVIMLGAIQIVAVALIMLYATRYPDTPCQSICLANPRPRQPTIASRLDEQAECPDRRGMDSNVDPPKLAPDRPVRSNADEHAGWPRPTRRARRVGALTGRRLEHVR